MSGTSSRLLSQLFVLAACLLALPVALAQAPLGAAVAIEDPSGDNVGRLRAALERARRGEGVARLVFWGASHTASDQYTGALRARLQRRYGDAGLGLVMPAQPFAMQEVTGVSRAGGAPFAPAAEG